MPGVGLRLFALLYQQLAKNLRTFDWHKSNGQQKNQVCDLKEMLCREKCWHIYKISSNLIFAKFDEQILLIEFELIFSNILQNYKSDNFTIFIKITLTCKRYCR